LVLHYLEVQQFLADPVVQLVLDFLEILMDPATL